MRSKSAIPILLSAVVLVLAAHPLRAEASCVAPPPKLIWSYPAPGATVPPNAIFWAIVPLGSELRVLLDGVELEAEPVAVNGGRIDPGPLTVGEHLLELIIDGDGGNAVLVPIEFTVAGEPVTPASGPVEFVDDDLEPLNSTRSAICAEVLASHDCYDTGQDAELVLETETRPLVWIVGGGNSPDQLERPVLWPGECGQPRLVIHSGRSACFTARAVDETGAERPANAICSNGCGCSSASGAALLLPVWLLALARRRGARARGCPSST